MSVLKVTITDDCIKILRHLKSSMKYNTLQLTIADNDDDLPFTDDDKYEYINLVLNGKIVENLSDESERQMFTDEQRSEWDILWDQLPLVLECILYTGSFEIGMYKAKFNTREWKRIA